MPFRDPQPFLILPPGSQIPPPAGQSAVFAAPDLTTYVPAIPFVSPAPGFAFFTGNPLEKVPGYIADAGPTGTHLFMNIGGPTDSLVGGADWLQYDYNTATHTYSLIIGAGSSANVELTGSPVSIVATSLLVNDGATIDLLAPWTVYTPNFTGSVTNPTNFTSVGHWTRLGKTIIGFWQVTANAGFTAGSGSYSIGLPFVGVNIRQEPGTCRLSIGGTEYHGGCSMDASDSKLTRMRISESSAAYAAGSSPWGATVPAAMTNGDICSGAFLFEAA